MPHAKLSDAVISKMHADHKPLVFWDTNQTGFGVKVRRTGTKTFLCQYRHQGRLRWYFIDRCDAISLTDARAVARQVRAKATLGEDPHGKKMAAKRGDTYGDLAEAYFKALEKAEHRSVRQYRGHWRRYIAPKLGTRKADTLQRRDFVDVKNRLIELGRRGSVRPVLAVAAGIITWGFNEQRLSLPENPAWGVTFKHTPTTRRPLTDQEFIAFWASCAEAPLPWGDMWRLMALTVQRGDEVRNMRWCDIDGDWWMQKTNKADRPHRVYLTQTARDLLDRQMRHESDYVFPRGDGQPYRTMGTRALGLLRDASGIADFEPHRLRHTGTTMLQKLGVERELRSLILNHAVQGVTAIYGHYDHDKERKATWLSLERHIRMVLGEAESNVVRLR